MSAADLTDDELLAALRLSLEAAEQRAITADPDCVRYVRAIEALGAPAEPPAPEAPPARVVEQAKAAREPTTPNPGISEKRKRAKRATRGEPCDCPKCGKTLRNEAGRAAHLRHCRGPEGVRTGAERTADSRATTTDQPQQVNGKKFMCDDCDFDAATVRELIHHTIAEHDRSPKPSERTPA